ncbi:MAG: beta-lactamase family protein [Aureispira sp.]|nr:beta-lactamase family protein [Aureispira sp.]
MKKITFQLLAVLIFLSFESCKKDDLPIKTNSKSFDIELFEANIVSAMKDNVVGYQYAINLNGQLHAEGADGWALKAEDANPTTGGGTGVEQDSRKKMHIASVSKMITAIAAIRCLSENNLTLDDFVYQSLPSSWSQGDCVGNITFRDLLDHKSGIKDDASSNYSELKKLFASGVECSDIGVKNDYENANFGLFRVLIPWITKGADLEAIKTDDAEMEKQTRQIFADYIKDKIFVPAGITTGGHDKPEADKATLYYDFDNAAAGAWSLSEYEGIGGYGFFISTYEVNAVLAYLMHSETYFSKELRTTMLEETLGFENVKNGENGVYYNKGGDWYTGGSEGRGSRTGIVIFPNGVEASLFINCRSGDHSYQTDVLVEAFDAAWK